jgi:hypothetical protein
MKRLTLLLLALLLTLAAAVPAHADKPVVWADFDFVSDWPYVDCRVLEQGYNFIIRIEQHGHEKQTAYFDNSGSVVRLLIDSDGIGYLYNENDRSFSIPNTYHATGHHDVISQAQPYQGIYRVTGLVYSLQMPGSGAVVHMSGQFDFATDGYDPGRMLKAVGNQTLDLPTICAYLAK